MRYAVSNATPSLMQLNTLTIALPRYRIDLTDVKLLKIALPSLLLVVESTHSVLLTQQRRTEDSPSPQSI
jgi:hypothetical protein